MIVTRLRVHPFGFFDDRLIEFQPGMNVVLGPNEAGKSTIFGAIKSSLLRTRLTKKGLAEYMGSYLPAGGGDTTRLELQFVTADGPWVLRRQWGASPGSELRLPSGGALVDEEAISKKLEEALPARPATFWKVLMTGQAELAETISSLRADSMGALSDLSDVLRRTVLETGGIAVLAFRELLAARLRQAFLHWDETRGGPQDGKGIENPWKKEIGDILGAWYARERLRSQRAQALSSEEAVDQVNGRIRETAVAIATAETFLSTNKKAAQDAVERRRLEAERTAVRLELEKLHKANTDWPVAAARLEEVRRSLEALDAARAPLEEEGRIARAVEAGRSLREKHGRVKKLVARLEEERAKTRGLRRIERRDLEEIRKAAATAAALRAGREAGRLSVTIAARSAVELSLQEDLRPETRKQVSAGETVSLHASGRLRIVHPDMEIEVRSGDPGALSGSEAEAAAQAGLEKLLTRCGVPSPEEAEERARAYEEAAAAVRAVEKSLADELEGQSAADLEARVAALGPEQAARPWADVSAELARLAPEREARKREMEELQARLAELAGTWGTADALVDKLADARRREKEIVEAIARCAPLPEGFSDTVVFLKAYEKARDDLAKLGEERALLSDRKHELERHAPEQSSEELAAPLKEAEAAFEAARSRGRALQRITSAVDALLGESDTAVMAGMRAELDPLIRAMSLGRHERADLDGSLPRGMADGRGRSLPWELLSGGTRDMLALALRLAMASFLLAGSDGFLMLDDPLVEMDPDRQRAAAEALKSFAAGRQLILFTCHPSVAELLGGHLIRL